MSAAEAARAVGITGSARGGLLPEQKLEYITRVQGRR